MDNFNISICVTFIAAIFGIAYPILLQVISRLDEKYNSTIIIDLFNQGYQRKFFTTSVGFSLVFIFLWMLRIPPTFEPGGFTKIIENSAEYLLILSTLSVIISFFLLVARIFTYYTPNQFLNYLMEKNNKAIRQKNFIYFYAISDLLNFSIRNQNENIVKLIWSYMSRSFREFRDSVPPDKEVVFPPTYYEVVSRTIEELTNTKNNRFAYFTQSTAGSAWLLGSSVHKSISKITYDWIWKDLRLILSYDRAGFILYHWENAYNYFRYALKSIPAKYSEKNKINNQKEIEKREDERNEFLNFHCALGGLLLYKRQYKIINNVFRYTQGDPPEYVLLPKTMNEVFKLYFDFEDSFEGKYPFINSEFRFLDRGGLEMDPQIRGWICSYITLLFLRQYTLLHTITQTPLTPPRIPPTQIKKKQWIDSLDNFRSLVIEINNNKELLNATGLDFITDKWCDENHKRAPLEFIDNLKKRLHESLNVDE